MGVSGVRSDLSNTGNCDELHAVEYSFQAILGGEHLLLPPRDLLGADA
jgi:hypothetical protein